MAVHRMGPPEALILALHQQERFHEFVETGTYLGDTTAWAAQHFPRVTTVELSPGYHAAAQARFRKQSVVRALHGNSSTVLREIVYALPGPALFWLDAHWSGLDTAGREYECPLLEEIGVINGATDVHTVLVDDARLFCAPPPRPHRSDQWPDLAETVSALRHGGQRHVVLFDDVFVAVPQNNKNLLNGWLQDEAAAARPEGRLTRWWRRIRG